MSAAWGRRERALALTSAAREGVELIVIGGGITGAGVLRDAALRGLRALLLERGDFASGTSSQTSKMIHGGLRYLAEGQLGVTRESCRERDLLARLNPNLVWPLPFLFCAYEHGRSRLTVRAGLTLYRLLAGARSSGFQMLSPEAVQDYSRDLDARGLRGAGLYFDQQVDDARFVLETIKDALRCGAQAVNHAEVTGFDRRADGQLCAVRVRDRLAGIEHVVRAERFVNAAGPGVERVRGLDRARPDSELRPAKGIHAVIPRARLHADAAIAITAEDGRNMFVCPWQDVHLIGTTDSFTDEIDTPRASQADLAYLLAAANRAFPRAELSAADLISVYAGVRPLWAGTELGEPPSSVSREYQIRQDPSGLLSVAGGKLTTHRAMAEAIVDRVVGSLPAARRRELGRCRTAERPLRDDAFQRPALERELCARFTLAPEVAEQLIRNHGEDALILLERAPRSQHARITGLRSVRAEIAWAIERECAANLCDVLERRVRAAVFAPGQGLPEIAALAEVAAQAAGWDAARTAAEIEAYRARVAQAYTVQA